MDKESLHERYEELRELVFKESSLELLGVLEELGGSIVSKRFESVLQYSDARKTRIFPLDIVSIFNELAEDEDKKDLSKIKTAHFLNWCGHVLCWAHLIIDDVIDNGQTRYGRACWHRKNNVGLSAINDALLLDKSVTYLMSKKLEKEFQDILHEQMLCLCAGQTLNDLLSKISDLHKINGAVYEKMCTVQNSSLVTFPFMLGMQLAGKANKISDDRIKPVLLKIAVLLQMLNDYQDLYVDSKLLGKDGTDIQQRKCTWFAANFLEKAFPEKRESFKRIYGSEDPDRVTDVEALYSSLQMKEEFDKHKNDLCAIIDTEIASIKDAKFRHALYSVYQKSIGAKIEEAHF
ncbi:farnesyl pyrophosphate synthase-like [Culex pipiens pallens]|uniref:farnesyl pyrophosphate synthase-like n=1 Tax=Culex pipiens pallens TaxID=42434 RepID=UPI0019539A91|nr:farnesyl pyrophosphate synthase-like [Culex pipiens pallens]